MDFNIFVSVTERCEHLYISRTLELSFERNGLAAMVVLGSVGNIYLPNLKDRPLNVKKKKINKKTMIMIYAITITMTMTITIAITMMMRMMMMMMMTMMMMIDLSDGAEGGIGSFLYLGILQLSQMKGEVTAEYI